MAENSVIISAEEEAKLLKPIDEYVEKIQKKIDALRVDGSDKVNDLKNQIAIAKENKNLSKAQRDKIIENSKKELENAKKVEADNKEEIKKLIAEAEDYLAKHYKKDYYDVVNNSLHDISISYEGAREAVSYRVLYGTKRAINIAEIVPKESKKTVPLEETRMQDLFRAIHVGDQEEIRKEAIKEIEKLHKNADTISQYNLATMEIVSGFFKFCANNSMDFNDISGNVQNLYERVTQLDETSMTNWIINMSTAISEKLKSTRNSTSRRMITDAQNIVKQRYMEPDISLDEVCADLGVSNSYFSSIFKKETGQPFVTYLTDYRMDRAEELVLNTDEKSYKIAEKVGYQDANYFSYVFKKKFGVSPSKYRASGKKENEK